MSLLRVDIAVQNLTGGHIITSFSAYNGIEASGVVDKPDIFPVING